MNEYAEFRTLSPTTICDVLADRRQVVDCAIRPLWTEMPRVAGPAYPVECAPGDHLMLHAAIYRAPAGSVIVVGSTGAAAYDGCTSLALAGGNICAAAQRRGILAFVLDGAIRDVAEIRASRFPVFARGVVPIPGAKNTLGPLNAPVVCGGVRVEPGDIVVADEEGVVVVPLAKAASVLKSARERAAKDAATTLDEWEKNHRARVDELLRKKGFAP